PMIGFHAGRLFLALRQSFDDGVKKPVPTFPGINPASCKQNPAGEPAGFCGSDPYWICCCLCFGSISRCKSGLIRTLRQFGGVPIVLRGQRWTSTVTQRPLRRTVPLGHST